MPGPNSAPNGDAGLVRGHQDERFVFCKECHKKRAAWAWREYGIKVDPISYPARDHAAKHNVLRTGKTQMKRDQR